MCFIFLWIGWILFAPTSFCNQLPALQNINQVEYQYEVEKWLNGIDADLSQFNKLAGHLTWKLSTEYDEKASEQAKELSLVRNRWKNKLCESNVKSEWLTEEQRRKLYLFCRGPKFTDETILEYVQLLGELSTEYNQKVCIGPAPNRTCLHGEPDLDRLMKRTTLAPATRALLWHAWHDSVGPRISALYAANLRLQNAAARANGRPDMGAIWREELEVRDLEATVLALYGEVAPLYERLHAVVRHKLAERYPRFVRPAGAIPVHLLGGMWGQDWTALIGLFEIGEGVDLDGGLRRRDLSVGEMAVEAEDFYTSLALPRMTATFWRRSLFEGNPNTSMCHGTAANLFNDGDFRMIMCGETNMDDFYVIHHEMGHIEYYMAYEQQSSFFQDGTNTAFHESIGDAVMHGVMTPQHLHRLNLITDKQLINKSTDLHLLLYQALSKLPELSYALILDKFRWELFRDGVQLNKSNAYYWQLSEKYRGIVPPDDGDRSDYFDAGAKFHVPDNTPYVRYFLSGIVQMQMFKSFCELAMYGRTNVEEALPLQRCDIYGAKNIGKTLLKMMEKGSSIKWKEALRIVSGVDEISTGPLLEYYKPLYKWLNEYIELNNVYVGW